MLFIIRKAKSDLVFETNKSYIQYLLKVNNNLGNEFYKQKSKIWCLLITTVPDYNFYKRKCKNNLNIWDKQALQISPAKSEYQSRHKIENIF